MLRRKVEKEIVGWLRGGGREALLVDGARQVGKTFIIRSVLEDEGCDWVEFNLIQTPEIVPLLERSRTVDDMAVNLSLLSPKPLAKGRTILFFDEIQEFKELATKIKFWVDDGSFRYILSGSLLGVELRAVKSAPVGCLRTLRMSPLDFEEFLQIFNFTPELKTSLQRSFQERTAVDGTVHSRLIEIFHLYLAVGGMPKAVEAFRLTRSLREAAREHEDIREQYKMDFTRYEAADKRVCLTKIYDQIPAQLASKNKRFNFADLRKGFRYERSENDFIWLAQAGVALPVYNVSAPEVPLMLNEKSSLFKLFLSDVGMLTTIYGSAAKLALLSNDRKVNFGAVYENVVAQELKAHGFQLYYYNSKKFGEIDFLVELDGKALPIEVKSGKDYQRHSALSNMMGAGGRDLDEALVLSEGNVKVEGKIVYCPIYMLMFIKNEIGELPRIDMERLFLDEGG